MDELSRITCRVGDDLGYFHTWGYDPNIGTYGIVELLGGTKKIDPEQIWFMDEKHMQLIDLNELWSKRTMKDEQK